jgi:hypothetical protein
MPTIEIKGLSVVFVGTFNAKIFQPAWLSAEKLLPDSEAKAASNLLVSEEVTRFELPWLYFYVTPSQFAISSTQESHFEMLRDLAVGMFRLLRHTPIKQLGINFDRHYRFEDESKWNNFGHALAPKDVWRKFMTDPGLNRMTVVDKAPRKDGWPGVTRVEVASSIRVKQGIYILVNNHYETSTDEELGATTALKALEQCFPTAIEHSENIFNSLMSIM